MSAQEWLTVGEMVKQFGISRTSLLYYDEINLLKPSKRSAANYRLYTDTDVKKMQRIMLFRSAGLALEEIKKLTERKSANRQVQDIVSSFEHRLLTINEEIATLDQQREIMIRLLKDKMIYQTAKGMTKERWSQILSNAGLDEKGMQNWHQQYEKQSPKEHQIFLESLNLAEDEIKRIRLWSMCG